MRILSSAATETKIVILTPAELSCVDSDISAYYLTLGSGGKNRLVSICLNSDVIECPMLLETAIEYHKNHNMKTIFTHPAIRATFPIKCSKTINYGGSEFVVATVSTHHLELLECGVYMGEHDIDWWCEITDDSTLDPMQLDVDMNATCILERIERSYGLSKIKNVAAVIGKLATFNGLCPVDYWDSTIETP